MAPIPRYIRIGSESTTELSKTLVWFWSSKRYGKMATLNAWQMFHISLFYALQNVFEIFEPFIIQLVHWSLIIEEQPAVKDSQLFCKSSRERFGSCLSTFMMTPLVTKLPSSMDVWPEKFQLKFLQPKLSFWDAITETHLQIALPLCFGQKI